MYSDVRLSRLCSYFLCLLELPQGSFDACSCTYVFSWHNSVISVPHHPSLSAVLILVSSWFEKEGQSVHLASCIHHVSHLIPSAQTRMLRLTATTTLTRHIHTQGHSYYLRSCCSLIAAIRKHFPSQDINFLSPSSPFSPSGDDRERR